MARRALLIGLAAVAWLSGGLAWAQAPAQGAVRVRLEWRRSPEAETCAGAEELATGTERLLGRVVFARDGADAPVVHGQVARQPDGRWSAHLVLIRIDGQAGGERNLAIDAPDCHALDQSLLIVLALMVDFDRDRVTLRLPTPLGPVPAPATPERLGSIDPGRMALGVGGVVARGLLPGVATAAVARVARGLGLHWDLEAQALFWLPTVEPSDGPGAETWAWQLGLGACRRMIGGPRVQLQLCVTGDAGRFQARGVGLDITRAASGTLVDLALAVRGVLALPGALELRVGGAAITPLIENRFLSFNPVGHETLFQSAPVAQRIEIEIGIRSPR